MHSKKDSSIVNEMKQSSNRVRTISLLFELHLIITLKQPKIRTFRFAKIYVSFCVSVTLRFADYIFKKIQKSLESKKDTNISVDCGKAGVCYIEFTNFENNSCDISMRLKDLGKYMKFSKEVDSEWTDHRPWQDLYQTMLIILRNIQRKL